MKNTHLLAFLSVCALVAAIASCTLEKEPEIPTGASNEQKPGFLSANAVAISHDSIQAKARLGTRGNLRILQHGWVWAEKPGPTLLDNKLELGILGIDSFETFIPNLTLGKTYHLRPFIATGSGETYGPEQTIAMGIPKLDNPTLVANLACTIRVQGHLETPTLPSEYGVVYLKEAGRPTLQKKDGKVPGTALNNGTFQVDLTMLSPNTTYFVRTYAVTPAGTGYGKVLPVATPASSLQAANFGINTDAELFQGAIVQFTNLSVGATTYSWDFGDGQRVAEASPVHTFDALGNKTVRFTAEKDGCMLAKDTILKIVPNPFKDYWVGIPGGSFDMGCTPEQEPDCQTNEKPVHRVTLSPFFMGKTEVTQGQWLVVTGNNPSYLYNCGLDCPVEFVDWNRIINVFIPALNQKTGRIHRLPTEAEWEYAARGGEAGARDSFLYAGDNNIDEVAWYSSNASSKTHPVGSKKANQLGLYDMSGNVWEWCSDWYDAYPASAQTDPKGAASGSYRVFRGGSVANGAVPSRVASRNNTHPDNRGSALGFRLVFVP